MKTEIHSDRFILFKESFTYMLTKIVPGVSGFFAVIIFFRLIGAEEYGKYSIFLSLIMVLSAFCTGWLNQSILRFYSKYQRDKHFWAVLVIGMLSSVVFGVIILYLFGIVKIGIPVNYGILTLFLVGVLVFKLIFVLYQAALKPKQVLWLTTIQTVFALVIPIILIKLFAGNFHYLLLGIAFSFWLSAFIFLPRLVQLWQLFKLKTISKEAFVLLKLFFKFGWPLSMFFVASLSLAFLDRFLIGTFWGTQLTGIYAGFSDLVIRSYSIVFFPITLAIHPRIMHHWNLGQFNSAARSWVQAIKVQIILFILIIAGIMLLFNQIFTILKYLLPAIDKSYANLLLPLSVSGFLWQFSLLIHKPLELNQKSHLMLVSILVAVVLNLIGNLIFLPQYGTIATAYTSVVSALGYIVMVIIFSRKQIVELLRIYSGGQNIAESE